MNIATISGNVMYFMYDFSESLVTFSESLVTFTECYNTV
jgi:hypothetical protein